MYQGMRSCLLCILVAAVAAPVAHAAFKPVRGNPANRLASLPIEDYRYDYAKRCLKRPQRGTLMLQHWLESHAGGSFWGIMRCEKLGRHNYSLHSEGRAIDWHLDVHNSADRREAKRLINLFLAPDKLGSEHALARRMGIQELIWNCRSWWSGGESMGKYSACYDSKGHRRHIDDTTAHRNHIHIGLNRPGAKGKTSFWLNER